MRQGNLFAIDAMLSATATRATVLTLDSDGLPPPFHALEVGQVEAFRLLQSKCPELEAALKRNKSSLNGSHGPNGVTLCQHIGVKFSKFQTLPVPLPYRSHRPVSPSHHELTQPSLD